MADHDTLYQETLANAQTEIRELAVEIEHLRQLLIQLERRKKAVEEICSAIRCWVEITGEDDGPDIPPTTVGESSRPTLPPISDGDRTQAERIAEFDCASDDAEELVHGVRTAWVAWGCRPSSSSQTG